MVSASRSGSTEPSTWVTSGSSKQRSTITVALVSRMWARNWLPSPSPFDAPRTRPAMSTSSTVAGITRAECTMASSAASRASGTATTPAFGSMVQNG